MQDKNKILHGIKIDYDNVRHWASLKSFPKNRFIRATPTPNFLIWAELNVYCATDQALVRDNQDLSTNIFILTL